MRGKIIVNQEDFVALKFYYELLGKYMRPLNHELTKEPTMITGVFNIYKKYNPGGVLARNLVTKLMINIDNEACIIAFDEFHRDMLTLLNVMISLFRSTNITSKDDVQRCGRVSSSISMHLLDIIVRQ